MPIKMTKLYSIILLALMVASTTTDARRGAVVFRTDADTQKEEEEPKLVGSSREFNTRLAAGNFQEFQETIP